MPPPARCRMHAFISSPTAWATGCCSARWRRWRCAAPQRKGPTLGEIIFAHPDVDQDRFRQLAKGVKSLGGRMTLYMSTDDRAFWLSKILRGAGRAGGEPVVVADVETIDISGLGTSLWSINHNVYASNPQLFGDLSR